MSLDHALSAELVLAKMNGKHSGGRSRGRGVAGGRGGGGGGGAGFKSSPFDDFFSHSPFLSSSGKKTKIN